jgi:SAM-dependent methyltransferase
MTEKTYQRNYANLAFPLNIYAHSLYLQEGNVDYLHYGLFKEGESISKTSARQVQQRATDLLLARLPPPPCRILEVGIGLGTTALQLAERGYTVTGISPDPQQIALTQQRVKESVTLECVTLEAFSAPAESYDVILLQESAQYIQSLALFNKAYSLLAKQGFILIADEVSLRRTPIDVASLPLLTYTLAQAQRCGFELTEQVDLSAQAAPSVDYLLRVIEKHRATLLADLDSAVLDDLLNILREYQQKYRDGRYGYVLLKFAKTKAPRWKITSVTPQDKEAIRALFSEVFAPEQMSDAHWEWKYGQERGLGIAAWHNGKMVAHYGAIIREIHYFGQPKLAIQIADVMVSAKERSRLTRRGAFFLTAATFPECYVGYGARTWLGYGFPTQRAMKIAEHLGLYAPVGKMIELRWASSTAKPYLWTRIRHLQPQQLEQNKLIINRLWKKMASCLQQALVGVRDWDYVQHRYLLHPHKQYELLLVSRRFSGQALGIVVIHRQDETCRIMDIICDLKHLPEVIKQVRCMASGMKQVIVWITENFVTAFPKPVEQHDLDIQIPHSIWCQGVPPEDIEGHWWLMSGDTDFL